jgi:hypothetical protein
MKRNSLTTALLAGLAGAAGMATTANALNINPDGLGEVLVYPYYTVNKGNQTLISVVNTTDRVKAVKVRFLEGRNSREVLDFNLYLSPRDVWVGALTAAGGRDAPTGPARLTTQDTSCTVPAIPEGGVDFRNFEFVDLSAAGGANRQDHPNSLAAVYQSLDRTREGYVEIIEMGMLQTGTGPLQLAEEATHVRVNATIGTVAARPANCAALVNAWTPGAAGETWVSTADPTANPLPNVRNIDPPTGGLYGGAAIVDVANGTMVAYNADAIDGFYDPDATANQLIRGALHTNPGSVEPSLAACNNDAVAPGRCVVNLFRQGQLLRLDFAADGAGESWDAISALYMNESIFNEYVTETGIASRSEWVITFPTKEFYVNQSPVRRPFVDPFQDNGQSCQPIGISIWNREEMTGTPGSVDFSPRPPGSVGPALCFEAQIVTFNQTGSSSAIFGSTYARNLSTTDPAGVINRPDQAPQLANGHAQIRFNTTSNRMPVRLFAAAPAPTGELVGLPVTGFWAWTAVNSNAQPGILASFSGAFRHRASRVTSGI